MFAEDLVTRCSIKMKSNILSLPVTPCSTNEAQMVGKENSPGIYKSIMLKIHEGAQLRLFRKSYLTVCFECVIFINLMLF